MSIFGDFDDLLITFSMFRTLYNLSFIAPLFVVLLWVKPVARHYLTVREWPNRGVM